MSSDPAQRVQLGYIAGVHGVRGALRVKLFNAQSETLEPGVPIELCPRGEGEGKSDFVSHEVSRIAPKPGSDMARLWLVGIESREAAEALRSCEVWVDRARLPELDEGEYYLTDLIGLSVVRKGSEEEGPQGQTQLGEISGVTSNSMQELLCVRLRGREWLLPALPPFIVDIDFDARRVIADVHDEMLPEV